MLVYKLGEVRAVRRKSVTDKATGEVRSEALVTVESSFVDVEGNERIDVGDFVFPDNALGGSLFSAKGKYIAVACEYTPSFFNRSSNIHYESSVRQVRSVMPLLFDKNPVEIKEHRQKEPPKQ